MSCPHGYMRFDLCPRCSYTLPRLRDFKVSNTPQGTRQTQRTPGTPDPPTRKDRST